jgi:hypothetical protein
MNHRQKFLIREGLYQVGNRSLSHCRFPDLRNVYRRDESEGDAGITLLDVQQ